MKRKRELTEPELLRAIECNIERWENVHQDDYIAINRGGRDINELSQLLLNGDELYFGTLPEISAVLEAMGNMAEYAY